MVMDNLPAHKVTGGRAAIKAAGAELLYLPPCGPDFNPIERAFAKLKALLRYRGPDDRGLVAGDRSRTRSFRPERMSQRLCRCWI